MGGIQYSIIAVDQTKDGIDSAKRGVDDLGVHYSDTLSNVAFKFSMIAVAATAAMAVMYEGWNKTAGVAIAYQDQIEQLHTTLGVTNEDAQKWRAAAVATDTSIQSVAATMRYLTQRISDSGDAGDRLRDTLKKIGVDARTSSGEFKDSSQLMQEILAGLSRIPAGTERAAAAAQIFGRNWSSIAEMIENADVAAETFKSTQPLFSDEELERIDAAKLKLALFNEQLEAAEAKTGAAVISLGESVVQGAKLWNAAIRLDLQGIRDLADETTAAEQHIQAAVRKSWESKNTPSGSGNLGSYTSMGSMTGPGGSFSYGLFKQGADDAAGAQENLYLSLSDNEREIKYLSEVTIPKYEEALKEALMTGEDVAQAQYDLANAMAQLEDVKTKDRIDAETEALRDYNSELQKTVDLKKKEQEETQDYLSNVQAAGGDLAEIRRLSLAHQKTMRKLKSEESDQAGTAEEAAQRYFEIYQGKTPLEEIKGTKQYEEAQAKTGGDLVINIDGKQTLRVPGVINGNGMSKAERIQRGIGTSTDIR